MDLTPAEVTRPPRECRLRGIQGFLLAFSYISQECVKKQAIDLILQRDCS